MQNLLEQAEKDDRLMTADEQKNFDEWKVQKADTQTKIDQHLEAYDAEVLNAREPDLQGFGTAPAKIVPLGLAIEQDPKRGFKSLGDFGLAVQGASLPGQIARRDERLDILAAASGNSMGVGSEGGWLVPPQFSQTIWDGLNTGVDNLLSRCDSYTVTGDSLTFNANAETSRATGSRWGGIQGYWIAEADQMTASKPKLRQVKLEPQQLAVLCYATDKLLKNAVATEQWLTRAAVDEINFLVGDSIVNGTGAGQPLGILTGSAKVSVAKDTAQTAKTITFDNVINMWARMHARSRGNAVWLINQDAEPSLAKMSMNVGTGGVPVYLPANGIADSPLASLMGRPVIPIEYAQTLGTVGDIILADMKSYAVGLRGGIESAMSMHLRFDYNETAFRFLFEVDGQPWLASPITPFKGSNTTSPFVVLATRA